MTTGPSRPRRLIGLVAVLALATAACSSDGSDGAADAPTTTTTTSAAAAGDDTATSEPAALVRYADYESVSYDDPTHWVCRPDLDDVCDGDLDTTVIAADGTTTVEPFEAAEDPPIDCFYIYPTVSTDPTTISDWDISDGSEEYVTFQQAARLGSACRVFAPVYRQRTLAGIAGRGEPGDGPEDPFVDVLDAFETYMANDNDGRGIVLIGHSQGAGMLNQLIQSEFDPHDDVRDLLVGAYLAGGSVAVPEGEVVGGDFANVALCTTDGEVGCVTTWASFRQDEPPPENSLFGYVRNGEGVAGCVNPAGIGREDVALDARFATRAGSEGQGEGSPTIWLDGEAGEAIDTPFVAVPGLVTGTCVSENGFDYLAVTVNGDPADPRSDDINGDLTPVWGLHLVDVSLVMGDIVTQVEAQTESYDS